MESTRKARAKERSDLKIQITDWRDIPTKNAFTKEGEIDYQASDWWKKKQETKSRELKKKSTNAATVISSKGENQYIMVDSIVFFLYHTMLLWYYFTLFLSYLVCIATYTYLQTWFFLYKWPMHFPVFFSFNITCVALVLKPLVQDYNKSLLVSNTYCSSNDLISALRSGLVGVFQLFLERPRLRPVYKYHRTSKDWTGPLWTGLFRSRPVLDRCQS